jgi:hypothetical protein
MQRGRYIRLALLPAALAVAGWSVQSAQAAAPTVTGLPAGWSAQALGDGDDDPQTVKVENGVWTLQAGGSGFAAEEDGGLLIHMPHSGNGSITAHLLTQAGDATQTAVSIREGTEPGARAIRLIFSNTERLLPQVRKAADTAPSGPGAGSAWPVGMIGFSGEGSDTLPGAGRALGSGIWLGADRNGDRFTLYTSEDGKVWTPVASTAIIDPDEIGDGPFPADAQFGIEATKTEGDVATITLDNVTVSNELLGPRAVSGVAYMPRDKSVIVAWNPVSVADGEVTYNVYSIDAGATQRTKVNQEPIKTSSFLVEGLTNGTAYRYGVTAVLNGVESALALPFPTQGGRGIGMAIPMVPLENGMVLHTIGTNDPGTVTVEGTGRDAKYTFQVGGFDFWEAGDGGSILAVPMEGNLDVSLRLLEGPTDHGDGWAQGGPTFRETLDPGSRMAIAVISAANTMQFKRRHVEFQRPINNDSSQSSGDNTTRPVSSRIVRNGDEFSAFFSEDDGQTWEPMGDVNPITIPNFAKTPYVGQIWCSHEEGTMAEVVVDHFEIKPAQ